MEKTHSETDHIELVGENERIIIDSNSRNKGISNSISSNKDQISISPKTEE